MCAERQSSILRFVRRRLQFKRLLYLEVMSMMVDALQLAGASQSLTGPPGTIHV